MTTAEICSEFISGNTAPLDEMLQNAYSSEELLQLVTFFSELFCDTSIFAKEKIVTYLLEVSKIWNKPPYFTYYHIISQVWQWVKPNDEFLPSVCQFIEASLADGTIEANAFYTKNRGLLVLRWLDNLESRNLGLTVLKHLTSDNLQNFFQNILRQNNQKIAKILLENNIQDSEVLKSLFEEKTISNSPIIQPKQALIHQQSKPTLYQKLISKLNSDPEFLIQLEEFLVTRYSKQSGIYTQMHWVRGENISLLIDKLNQSYENGCFLIEDIKNKELLFILAMTNKHIDLAYALYQSLKITPIQCAQKAIYNHCSALLERLLKDGALNLNKVVMEGYHETTFLHMAARTYNLAILNIIIDYMDFEFAKQFANIPDRDGNTIAHFIAKFKTDELEKALILAQKVGVEFNCFNKLGLFPVQSSNLSLDKKRVSLFKKYNIQPLETLNMLIESGKLEELKLQLPNSPLVAIHNLFKITGPHIRRTSSFGRANPSDWKDAGTISITNYQYVLYIRNIAMIRYLTMDVLMNTIFFQDEAAASQILESSKQFVNRLIQDAYPEEERRSYREIWTYLNNPKQQENVAQIRKAARNLLRLRWSDSPIFSIETPDEILVKIASFCGDKTIHNEEESEKIARENLSLKFN